MLNWLQRPFFRGIIFGGLLIVFGVGSVWLFAFARSGEAWQQLTLGRLTPATFFFQRGNFYFGGTEYDLQKALTNFERAATFINQYNDPIHYQIGRVYFIKGDLTAALIEFNKQLAENPNFTKSYYMRGLTYGYRNQFKQAEEDFLKYLEAHPNSWAGHNDLVWVYFRSGQYEQAEKYARAGLSIAPKNAWLSNALGGILINQGRYDEAKRPLLDAKAGFVSMGPEGWGVAYPGNDPRVYEEGYQASLKSVEDNIKVVEEKLKGE